ncbi:PREDICTED: protein LURP-one-related 15-like [Camelina sativa]|uniref:Protein LURP-one-related 15-like n=1 Tax=Camelina sativa TaxID=90675 RepID=A0ABM0TME8_CAMSA|nr:PREDICTED: protein LURP-one-related 15-like [Camelina sativa]
MQQPYVYAYPQGGGSSVPLPPQAGVIVDPRYCSPQVLDLAIVRKLMKITDGNFVITNVHGNLLFEVKDPLFALHDKRILLDASGAKVMTLKGKMVSMHDRWQVFRGGSTEPGDLLYTVKRSHMLQLKAKLDVFLAHNTEEKRCDFRVKGTWHERSCVVYAGESDTIVAQMHEKHTVQSVFLGKDNFSVTVYPNVDYAFIASLIVILVEIE